MIEILDNMKVEELRKLYNKYFNTSFSLTDPYKKIYCYIEKNKIVGFIDYSLIYDRIELNYIFVDSNYRLNGIASKLINKMLEEKIDNISLEVKKSNKEAISLYRKFGFEIVAMREKYYNGEDAYLMVRK